MFGMAILTHGEERGVLLTADEKMNIKEFVDEIKMNSTLIQKPKVRIRLGGLGQELLRLI